MYNYSKYWEEEFEKRSKNKYYENLYSDIKNLYKFSKNDDILDIGGGNGHFSYYIGAKNVTILDISDSGLSFAANKFGFKTFKGDLNKRWPIYEESIDKAICNEVLEHLEFPSLILAETYRILKPEGVLYIGQPNMKPDGKHHLKRVHLNYLKYLLKENGFKIEEVVIKPGLITNKFSNLKKPYANSIRSKTIIILGSLLGLFLSERMKKQLSIINPKLFGGFYFIKATK